MSATTWVGHAHGVSGGSVCVVQLFVPLHSLKVACIYTHTRTNKQTQQHNQ